LPVSKLRTLNPASGPEIDTAVAATGLSESALRYLPMRGPAADGAVLVSQADGRVLKVLPLFEMKVLEALLLVLRGIH
jgi:hypothetical protein